MVTATPAPSKPDDPAAAAHAPAPAIDPDHDIDAKRTVIVLAISTAFVFGSMTPFPAGTIVYPHLGTSSGAAPRESDKTVLSAASWFFLVNLDPFAEYAHDVEYVFVDAETGAVQRLAALRQRVPDLLDRRIDDDPIDRGRGFFRHVGSPCY